MTPDTRRQESTFALTCDLGDQHTDEKNVDKSRPHFATTVGSRWIDVDKLMTIRNTQVEKAKAKNKRREWTHNGVYQQHHEIKNLPQLHEH